MSALRRFVVMAWNWLRGYRFFWVEDAQGRYLDFSPRTCPYPLRNDWSAKACIKAGDCGCDERNKACQK